MKKKYTNPSFDIITVLAGLDEVDGVISDFVAVLDGIIRNGKDCKYSLCINAHDLTKQSMYDSKQSRRPSP